MAFDHPYLVPQALALRAQSDPDAAALRHVDGTELTFGDAYTHALRWASAFERAGVVSGEPVVTLFVNSFEASHAWFGCAWLGAIESPVNTNYRGDWLRHVIDNTGAKLLLTLDRFADAVFDVAHLLEHLETIVVFGDAYTAREKLGVRVIGADEFLANAAPTERAEPGPWDTSCLIYTSGTTGRSKAVKVPWGQFRSSLESGYIPVDRLEGIRLYAPYPVFHLTGKGAFYYPPIFGGASVIREAFSVSSYWDDVRDFDANAAVILGPLAQMLMNQPERDDDAATPMTTMCMVPVIPEVDRFKERFGLDVYTTYNMTEINCPIIQQHEVTSANHRSCGQVRAGVEVRVVDEHDQQVAVDEPGEMIMRGEPWELNTGYWNMADKTNDAWRNGWFHTGDAFTYDADGNYYFVDRAKDYIRRRGENISSFEVEALVNEHPDIIECGACAVPADEGEDEVKVAVVVHDPQTFDPADLIAFLVPRMPRFAIPRFVEVWDELPKTEATARIQKAKIRDAGVSEDTWDRVSAGVSVR